MTKALIHYAEIALKGKNKRMFEAKLVENIKKSAERQKAKLKRVEQQHKRILAEFEGDKGIDATLKNVFGIRNYSIVAEVKKDIESIKKKAAEMMDGIEKKVRFDTRRADKRFPLTSVEVNKELGAIANKKGLKVDYKNAEHTIYTEITVKTAYMHSEKIGCEGGLPVGTSGKVLCLLSGGIDSPAATWCMMKRGCKVDFLHIHPFSGNKKAIESKIRKTAEKLNDYQFGARLYLIPYQAYKKHTIAKIPKSMQMPVFKHYILKLADKLAKRYKGIVTGDNIGQVASQTLENIHATGYGIEMPIYRPLLTYNKEEIMNLARRIGTYELSIEPYKDCCSILSQGPNTRTTVKQLHEALEKIDFEELLRKSKEEIEKFEV